MECYEGKILSYCVPVNENGEYVETKVESCQYCGGRGRTEHTITHTVKEQE
jgi:fructose-1,6-bisphosphatase